MRTIALVMQKGGSGKSTLAIGLAVAAQERGHQVRLLDTDPQATVANWGRRRIDFEPIIDTAHSSSEITTRLDLFAAAGTDVTIIDTASGDSAVTRAAMRAADLCVIPARPSQADLESSVHTLRTLRRLGRPFCFVLTQTPVRHDRATVISMTAHSLSAAGVLALPYIGMAYDHMDALGAGLGVTELAPEGKSAEEIRSLWQWMSDKLAASWLAEQEPALRLVG